MIYFVEEENWSLISQGDKGNASKLCFLHYLKNFCPHFSVWLLLAYMSF